MTPHLKPPPFFLYHFGARVVGMKGEDRVLVKVPLPFKSEVELELEIKRGINIFYGPNATGKSILISAIVSKMKEAGLVRTIGHIRGCKVTIGDFEFCIDDAKAWKELTAEPFIIDDDKLRNDLHNLLSIGYLHGGYALKIYYEPEYRTRWLSIDLLSYGEKKTLALLLVAKMAGLVVIEAFEGGLHFDLAIELLDVLEDYRKYVLVETHMGILVTTGLKKGWNVYYVSRDGVTRLTMSNILETGLFKDEAEALTRLVPNF
jgi:predicted ATPase